MRKFFSLFIMIIVTFGILINDAEARRFGGGRSFGMQRAPASYSRVQSPAPGMARQPSPASKWLGPLAGLAVGGLLASLMMGHGLGSGMMSWLMVAGVGFLLWNMFRRRMQPAAQFNQGHQSRLQEFQSQFTPNTDYAPAASAATVYPLGFDKISFLREAKVHFIRLQAAYDNKNLADIREFTAPEVFAEIQLQFQERGDEANVTEVVSLEAELLDVNEEYQTQQASVHFTGMIKENPDQAAGPLNEIWHFKKLNHQWVVAGVQQHLN